jgi:hypothetical protein
MLFGSRTIVLHLLRGAAGLACLYGVLATIGRTWWPSIILLPAAVFFLRGCPMCWTMGLIETIVMTIHKFNERKAA